MQPNNQNPDQPDQPAAIPTLGTSSTARVLQPISSEDDIRREIEAPPARPEPTQPQQPAAEPIAPYNNMPGTPQTHSTTESTYYSAQPPATQVTNAAPRSGIGFGKIVLLIIGVGILVTLGFGGYAYLYGGKIAVADLTEATVQQTTYLRPKTWGQVPSVNDTDVYSNSKKGSGKLDSFVGVGEKPGSPALIGASDSLYQQVRNELAARAPVSALESFFERTGIPCNDKVKFNAVPDTKKTTTAIGLLFMSGTCTRSDGAYTIKSRTVVGNDGRARIILVGAPDKRWADNQEALQKMLDSIGQAVPRL